MKKIKDSVSVGTTHKGTISGTSTGTSIFNTWNPAKRIMFKKIGESIEIIYKETSKKEDERVFKIVYSCVNGKWNESERIYGKIIPAQDEDYEF